MWPTRKQAITELKTMLKTVTLKVGNMRKPQEFVIYPDGGNGRIKLQSDDCIIEADLSTGAGKWARNKGGAYFIHLAIGGNIGRGPIQFSPEQLATFQSVQPQSGDKIGPGVYIG